MSIKTRIRNWLDVDYEKSLTEGIKDYRDEVKKLEGEMWKHRHLLQKRAITKCPVCSKTLKLWPLETEAYYTRDNQAYHVKCYNEVAK